MPFTVQDKIDIAKVSQYLCGNAVEKGGLFGGGIDLLLERKIYCVRKSIEFIYGLDPNIIAVGAIGYITIIDVGNDGDEIEVFCDVPVIGIVSFGTYEKQNTDTDTTILAASIAAALSYTGFIFDSATNVVSVTAPAIFGAEMNIGSRLSIVVTNAAWLLINSTDSLLINSTDKLII